MTNTRSAPSKDSITVARGAGFSLFGALISGALRFGTSLLITRSLGADLFGRFALANRVASMGGMFSSAGQEDAVIHFIARYRGRGDWGRARGAQIASMLLSLSSSVVVSASLFLGANLIAQRVFGNPALAPIIRILALGVPFAVVGSVLAASLRGQQEIRHDVNVRAVAIPMSRFLLYGLFVLLGWRIFGLVWAVNLSFFVGCLVAAYYVAKSRLYAPDGSQTIYDVRGILSFSVPVLILGIVNFSYANVDVFFLGYYHPTRDVGIYALAIRILAFMQLPVAACQSLFVPLAAELHGSDQLDRLRILFRTTVRWVIVGTLPIYLALVLFAGPFLSLFGQDFLEGETVLIVLGSISLTNCFAVLAGYAVYMSGRSWTILANALFLLATSVALYGVLVPELGMVGASVGRAIAFALFGILVLVEAFVLLGLQPFEWSLLKPVFAAGVASALCYFSLRWDMVSGNALATLALCSLFFLAYGIGVYGLGVQDEDRALFKHFKQRLRGGH